MDVMAKQPKDPVLQTAENLAFFAACMYVVALIFLLGAVLDKLGVI